MEDSCLRDGSLRAVVGIDGENGLSAYLQGEPAARRMEKLRGITRDACSDSADVVGLVQRALNCGHLIGKFMQEDGVEDAVFWRMATVWYAQTMCFLAKVDEKMYAGSMMASARQTKQESLEKSTKEAEYQLTLKIFDDLDASLSKAAIDAGILQEGGAENPPWKKGRAEETERQGLPDEESDWKRFATCQKTRQDIRDSSKIEWSEEKVATNNKQLKTDEIDGRTIDRYVRVVVIDDKTTVRATRRDKHWMCPESRDVAGALYGIRHFKTWVAHSVWGAGSRELEEMLAQQAESKETSRDVRHINTFRKLFNERFSDTDMVTSMLDVYCAQVNCVSRYSTGAPPPWQQEDNFHLPAAPLAAEKSKLGATRKNAEPAKPEGESIGHGADEELDKELQEQLSKDMEEMEAQERGEHGERAVESEEHAGDCRRTNGDERDAAMDEGREEDEEEEKEEEEDCDAEMEEEREEEKEENKDQEKHEEEEEEQTAKDTETPKKRKTPSEPHAPTAPKKSKTQKETKKPKVQEPQDAKKPKTQKETKKPKTQKELKNPKTQTEPKKLKKPQEPQEPKKPREPKKPKTQKEPSKQKANKARPHGNQKYDDKDDDSDYYDDKDDYDYDYDDDDDDDDGGSPGPKKGAGQGMRDLSADMDI